LVPDPILTIDNLRAGYGKLTILHDLSVEIAAQRFTAVLGPNGSGKSTLLKSIFGMATVTGGSIRMRQRALVGVPTERVGRAGIAYVPQRNNVFADMTVRENLLLAVRNLDRRASARLLDEVYALFPLLNKRHQQCADSMSGGERQMLAIAIGWLAQPELMLLDEPTAGLTPLYASEVFETLHRLRDRMTLLVVEQNARSVVKWCDQVVILREGALAYHGDADANILHEYLGIHIEPRRMSVIKTQPMKVVRERAAG
jgi:branched-chain amino acid transport system ATP-binding protein